ncbi:MAG TPA: septum site-determining protein MinC [Aquifex aeolicus]|nr:septum site-determining protein MinC [Aquifex aeolicus]
MIEIKGKTTPVIYITIKEKGNIEALIQEISKKLNNKIFEGSLVIIENPEVLSEWERKKVEEILKKLTKGVFEKQKEEKEENRLLIINKSLRAGQRVEHKGDILILGDVNKDAEVLAGGNIIVFGKLRGIAKAGLIGDESAVIIALFMEPQMLQIGRKKAIPSDSESSSPGYPEIAKIENGEIILEAIEGAERWQKLL